MPGRDNGLRAKAYTPLADLDPRLADAMLQVLRDSGIAAYAVPVGSEVSGHFGNKLPERPTDRLYVDATAAEPAWQVLRTHLPSMDVEREGSGGDSTPTGTDPRADDEVWQQIISAYHHEPSDPVPPWPASEDLDSSDDDHADDAKDGQRSVTSRTTAGEAARHTPGPSDDEHFVPPRPPPVPSPDPVTAVSWAGLFGGPTYLLISTMIGWPIPGWAAFVAVAAFIGGFVALVVRMGDDPPPDSGPDDGAVV